MLRKPLKPRHEAFARAMALHGKPTRAATEAGYAASGASVRAATLLRKVEVVARIEDLQAENTTETAKKVKQRLPQLTRTWVIEKLMENAENALDANDRGAANRALELLGREVGAFVERKQIEVHDPLAGLDARRLRALIDDLDRAMPLIEGELTSEINATPMISTTYGVDVPELEPDPVLEGGGEGAGEAGPGAADRPPGARVTGAGWSDAGTRSPYEAAPAAPAAHPPPPGSTTTSTPPEEEEI